jgi:hypothetical protein
LVIAESVGAPAADAGGAPGRTLITAAPSTIASSAAAIRRGGAPKEPEADPRRGDLLHTDFTGMTLVPGGVQKMSSSPRRDRKKANKRQPFIGFHACDFSLSSFCIFGWKPIDTPHQRIDGCSTITGGENGGYPSLACRDATSASLPAA